MLSSDDEDESRDNDVYVADKASRELGPLEEETANSKYVCLRPAKHWVVLLSCICHHLTFLMPSLTQFPLLMSVTSHVA